MALIHDLRQSLSLPDGLLLTAAGIVTTILISTLYSILSRERPIPGFPVFTYNGENPKDSWLKYARQAINETMQKSSGPIQIMTGTGPKLILPNRFAHEIRAVPHLSFSKAFSSDFFVKYPGFEPLKQGLHEHSILQETVRVKLTQCLTLVTEDIVDEATAAIHELNGESPEWRNIGLKENMLHLVARLSSRVFLGLPLCRNERWLEISKMYTIDVMIASHMMNMVPTILRPIVHWFIPKCISCRRAVSDTRKLIGPEIERRKAAVDTAIREGRKPPKTTDAIGWMHEMSKGRKVDYAAAQLCLTFVAIHTTTENICQALLSICEYPDVANQLRQEIIEVIGKHGWAKSSLYKLKLMDSFLKEVQRVYPMASTSMQRLVEKETTLSDGTVLHRGTVFMLAQNLIMDPNVYPEPEKFDAARFLKMREQPGNENTCQLVSTTPEHLLFGHGTHACPGRFFASNELKIALCHLLLKYDWQYVPGVGRPAAEIFANSNGVSSEGQVQIRRRREEINLDLSLQ